MEADDVARLRVALARIARQLEREVSGEGLTHTQLAVLGTVCRQGPLGVSDLADREALNPTMLSRVISKLQDAGLVTRIAEVDDRRAARVQVTATGRKLHNRLRDRRTRLLTERLAGLPDDQAASILEALPALESLAGMLVGGTR